MKTIRESSKEFLNHCKFEKNLSSKTIHAYSTDLMQFGNFLSFKSLTVEIDKISKNEIRLYLEFISELKPKSIKRKIATIRAFFNFLEYEDQILLNPLRKMKIKIKESKTLPKVLDIREIKKILINAYKIKTDSHLNNAHSKNENLRNIVVLELLFSTGARVSEIANLKTANIETTSGLIKFIGKGNRERVIHICNKESLSALRNYKEIYKSKIESSGGYFLINRFGNKLSDQSIRTIVKNVGVRAGIVKHITPHMFRHSFATLLLEKDVDIKYIQAMLGHSSIMTTQIYTHVNQKKQKQILNLKHPRKDMNLVFAEA
jgi:integrase/recombinase XerD